MDGTGGEGNKFGLIVGIKSGVEVRLGRGEGRRVGVEVGAGAEAQAAVHTKMPGRRNLMNFFIMGFRGGSDRWGMYRNGRLKYNKNRHLCDSHRSSDRAFSISVAFVLF